ncbi:MAG: hypothetical protein U0805_11120 [Pirellulales bacterium]
MEAVARDWRHAKHCYIKHRHPAQEQAGIRVALRFVSRLYGFASVEVCGLRRCDPK